MRTMGIGLAVLLLAGTAARGDMISNPVGDGGIVVDGSRAEWAGLTSYPSDSVDTPPGDVDFDTFTFAHDSLTLYIRYTTHDGPGFGSAWRYNIFVDADQDRNTGFVGGGGQLPIGADLLIQGASTFSFTGGDQTTFSWNFIGGGSYNEVANDLELGIAVSLLPGLGPQFDWVGFGDNSTPDYVPDGGASGPSGDYHTYVIPEPATALLLLGGFGLVTALRGRARGAGRA